jgi:hypothetical protein
MPATEKPRAEPEIIPPGDLDGRPMRDRYHFDVHGGSQRIYVTRLGPFGIVVLGLLIALIVAVIPIVLLGALLIWIPSGRFSSSILLRVERFSISIHRTTVSS